MAEANTKLECLLAKGANGALHLFGNFYNWRFRFRVGLQFAIFCFGPPRALRSLLSRHCHVGVLRYRLKAAYYTKIVELPM